MHKRNVLMMIDNLHQQWEVPRYDLTTNPHRLVPRVTEKRAIDRNRLPVVLVSPASVVSVALDGKPKVNVISVLERFSVIEGLQTSQIESVPLDQISKPVKKLPTS